ncbi:hypothetical protein [Roseicyclus mahoneyensis]|uniref:Uncharacterized protein n=1 Tax=Roseicyclus mahoneyensis TaxID=164332 RepID=A0A316G8U9_9RHOB|nr:hypothetical protein [Roseicyclus mahoneyensis]PWK57314.1 hypothetical protein C7455_11240 [Roseicyclus mahoneyensis]
MSWRVANDYAERRFGAAARKQINMSVADKARDDGSGIWCSKGTIQRYTELGKSTVKRTISGFPTVVVVIKARRRPCKNGLPYGCWRGWRHKRSPQKPVFHLRRPRP